MPPSAWSSTLDEMRRPILRAVTLQTVASYSAVASLGALEEWAFRLSSATRKASSSKWASWAMFHTWAIITGQKTSNVIAVGTACCPKIPTPASTVVPFATGSIFMFRAV